MLTGKKGLWRTGGKHVRIRHYPEESLPMYLKKGKVGDEKKWSLGEGPL